MGAFKHLAKKLRHIAASKKKDAPIWANIKKFAKRARTRRIRVPASWKESKRKL
ncbi:MAG: 50S ribosomal protein L39e [Candidatus Aenigmatarchaeota archaeon]|nr:50S ribosomal protein L39e [Candidatus Aenigmarchaeota archaeon]